ncbi:MAG: 2-succinyl-5-enolpyruvyl-6-hydroxy-3-cyclohexene-1-carboxylate synthase, partial [Myxococcales bacterium]|nr:2-succinyl-5-enolpyruvyl-6-hydroxy-3-cyclohexene-1-carboxylate synthase [Myxococcales bacterium]
MRESASVQAEWARVLLGALRRAGVRDVVISPGSRSTPFVLAADAEPGLRCHDVIDEREAGFFALGQARVTGVPSLLLCTSGTAAAHYYPAVIEASSAQVPLLVLSADRPPELHGSGANQTIDQTRLFGVHVRRFIELGAAPAPGYPDLDARAFAALCRSAAQAVAAAKGPPAGAVHLNAPARKPLEPPAPEE